MNADRFGTRHGPYPCRRLPLDRQRPDVTDSFQCSEQLVEIDVTASGRDEVPTAGTVAEGEIEARIERRPSSRRLPGRRGARRAKHLRPWRSSSSRRDRCSPVGDGGSHVEVVAEQASRARRSPGRRLVASPQVEGRPSPGERVSGLSTTETQGVRWASHAEGGVDAVHVVSIASVISRERFAASRGWATRVLSSGSFTVTSRPKCEIGSTRSASSQ